MFIELVVLQHCPRWMYSGRHPVHYTKCWVLHREKRPMSSPPVRFAPATILICSLLLVAGPRWAASAEPTAAAPTVAAARADELPHFQPGLWEYRRTLMKPGADKPQVSTFQKCSNPTTEFRQKMAELEKKGCQFLPAERNQQGYISQWTCPTPAGPMRFRDVLISQSDTTYQTVSEAHSDDKVVRTTIDAVRLGECADVGLLRIPKSKRANPPSFLKHTPAGDVLESKPQSGRVASRQRATRHRVQEPLPWLL